MEKRTRICIVGGGSFNWTPILMQDLALTPGIAGSVMLHDIAPEPLENMLHVGQRIIDTAGADLTLDVTTDRAAALQDADVVIVTINVGGLGAMRHDLDIPARYGVVQSVGDTVGPGGLSRALRNIPVVAGIARDMERVCPDAWMLNISNPMATITRAVTKTSTIRAVGLCHEIDNVRQALLTMFDASEDEVELVVAGTNHLPWFLDLRVRGEDGFAMLRDYVRSGRPIPLKEGYTGPREPFQDRWQLKLALFETFGALPAAGDRHLAEFFPYFLSEQARRGEDYGVLLTSIEQRVEIGNSARARYAAWQDGSETPVLARSHEAVAPIIAALSQGRSLKTVVNLPNRGQIDNLPRDAVVETLGIVGPTGAHGIAAGALPPAVLNTIHPHVVNQEMIVEAALTGDRQLALQALLNDPLVRDFRTAPAMLDELLQAHAALIPWV
jgi:alpha-galactosidase/6-phospho-beta-glucosidase family protein